MRPAISNRLDTRLDRIRRGSEGTVADLELNHILASSLELSGTGQDNKGGLGLGRRGEAAKCRCHSYGPGLRHASDKLRNPKCREPAGPTASTPCHHHVLGTVDHIGHRRTALRCLHVDRTNLFTGCFVIRA